jgi:hypothetical protein
MLIAVAPSISGGPAPKTCPNRTAPSLPTPEPERAPARARLHPLSPTVPPAVFPAATTAVAAGWCRANLEKA